MIRVAVSGGAGRMGRVTAGAVSGAGDLELAHLYDPHHAGEVIEGLIVTDEPGSIATVDVVVEFTRPEVVTDNLRRWNEMGVSAVVGTSGFGSAEVDEVRSMWTHATARCLIVPNFAIGAVLMMRFAELAAPHFSAAEVIEFHHDGKVDAPSGTALATAARIGRAQPEQRRTVESRESVSGARGGDVEGVPVHAVRLPGIVADQDVVFGNPGESLTISHRTTDRAAFASGILLAIRHVNQLDRGVSVGLEPLLGL